MNLEQFGQLLILARNLVAQGAHLIEQQQEILARLENGGTDTFGLRQLLKLLEETQGQLRDRRDQIERAIDLAVHAKRI